LAQLDRPSLPATTDDLIEQVLHLPFARARERLVAELERRYVSGLVARHGGNVSRAAAASGLALRYFQLMRARHPK
jgi:hypothetical protein